MSGRRRFILGSLGLAGVLAVGWVALPVGQRLIGRHAPRTRAGEAAFNGWVTIDSAGAVTVLMPRAEMGQGTHTGLAMLLAEELDADWSTVRVAPTPIDPIYNNLALVSDGLPFHPDDDGLVRRLAGHVTDKAMRAVGEMVTGGSSGIRDLWLPMRQAGASARAMLVAEAAQRWGVAAQDIRVQAGRLSHASGREAGFGELAEAAGRREPVRDPPLKPAAEFRLIGQPIKRLDGPDKSTGRAVYGSDLVLPDMLHASVRMCPWAGGRLQSLDDARARQLPGVHAVVSVPGFHGGRAAVAVVARSWWQANRAFEQIDIRWEPPASTPGEATSLGHDWDTEALQARLQSALGRDDGHAFLRRGKASDALASASKTLVAEYRAPWLAHAPMEPMSCTVQVAADAARVWVPTQVPGMARRAVAAATGLSVDRVELEPQWMGGAFGRRLEVDFIAQAAAIAQAAGTRPVKTLWSRETDMANDFHRPACVARLEAGLAADGKLVAWRHVSASQAIVPAYMKRIFGLTLPGPDKTTIEGAFDQAYEIDAMTVSHVTVELPVSVGFWRSVGHSHQAFFVECFHDELAAAAGQDPLAWRLALLRQHPRHARVLQTVADLARWGEALAPVAGLRRGRGLALHESFGSVVAQVADVSVDAGGAIRVDRICCAIDCGTPVNPGLIRQQVDSAIVFGLSAALHGESSFEHGQAVQTGFGDQPVLGMAACPRIELSIVPSQASPQGVGEPPLPPVAPAVANAVFAATGQRLRTLPLRLV